MARVPRARSSQVRVESSRVHSSQDKTSRDKRDKAQARQAVSMGPREQVLLLLRMWLRDSQALEVPGTRRRSALIDGKGTKVN